MRSMRTGYSWFIAVDQRSPLGHLVMPGFADRALRRDALEAFVQHDRRDIDIEAWWACSGERLRPVPFAERAVLSGAADQHAIQTLGDCVANKGDTLDAIDPRD